eukprot:1186626-Prorocentrum_minimum.AAC.1
MDREDLRNPSDYSRTQLSRPFFANAGCPCRALQRSGIYPVRPLRLVPAPGIYPVRPCDWFPPG